MAERPAEVTAREAALICDARWASVIAEGRFMDTDNIANRVDSGSAPDLNNAHIFLLAFNRTPRYERRALEW